MISSKNDSVLALYIISPEEEEREAEKVQQLQHKAI